MPSAPTTASLNELSNQPAAWEGVTFTPPYCVTTPASLATLRASIEPNLPGSGLSATTFVSVCQTFVSCWGSESAPARSCWKPMHCSMCEASAQYW